MKDKVVSNFKSQQGYLDYRSIEDWYTRNCLSYQVQWTPQEIIFCGKTNSEVIVDLEVVDFFRRHSAVVHFEKIDQAQFLTARFELVKYPSPRYWLHLGLFILTVLTTIGCGATYLGDPFQMFYILSLGYQGIQDWWAGHTSSHLIQFVFYLTNGICFSFPFLMILTVHEFGHYFAARWYRMAVTLPYYIPMPFGIGSMGAMIALKSPMNHRRCVFDVGVAGPLTGFLLAVPIFYYGLTISHIDAFANHPGALFYEEGKSLLYQFLIWKIHGQIPSTHFLQLHPIAWAGWFGLFITALNLIPVGQLDGGHIAYAMFGKRHLIVARLFFVAILSLILLWWSYVVFALMLFFLIKLHHPPAVNEQIELDVRRRILGWIMFAILIMTFVPIPMRLMYG